METFNEIQRFRTRWAWLMMIAFQLLFVYALIQQVFLGKPFGSKPASDTVLIVITFIPFLLLLFMYSIQFITSFNDRGIQYRYKPFQRKISFIEWSDLHAAYLREYNSFYEYGGWGIRTGSKKYGKAINTSASCNIGLQLQFKDGRLLLIGTKNPEAIQEIIDKYFKKTVM